MPETLNALSKEILGDLETSLTKAYGEVEETIPADMLALLEELNMVDFCREIALDQADQRISRLLGNTANQIVQ